MKVLLVILAVIAFFVLLLAVKFRITVHYDDDVMLSVRWLFLKFNILPKKEKPEKKKKKEKDTEKDEDKNKKDEPEKKDEIIKEPKKKKNKDNMFTRFYHNKGVSGVIRLLEDAVKAIGGMFGRIGRAFLFEELYISLTVGAGDSAETAIKYGKTCSAVFPAMGYLVSRMRVKKYNVEITPDFIYGKNSARLHTQISVVPLRLINAVVVVAFELLFKVVLKLLKNGRKKTSVKQAVENKEEIKKTIN